MVWKHITENSFLLYFSFQLRRLPIRDVLRCRCSFRKLYFKGNSIEPIFSNNSSLNRFFIIRMINIDKIISYCICRHRLVSTECNRSNFTTPVSPSSAEFKKNSQMKNSNRTEMSSRRCHRWCACYRSGASSWVNQSSCPLCLPTSWQHLQVLPINQLHTQKLVQLDKDTHQIRFWLVSSWPSQSTLQPDNTEMHENSVSIVNLHCSRAIENGV